MTRRKRLSLFLLLLLSTLLLDGWTKHWARTVLLARQDGALPFLPGFLGWQYAQNTGAAFSALSGMPHLLGVASLAVCVVLTVLLLWKERQPLLLSMGLTLCVCGGLGNTIERLWRGHVTDFIHVEFVRFAIFNVADVFVCTGAGLCVLALLREELAARKIRH